MCVLVLAVAGCGGHHGTPASAPTPSATETMATSGPPHAESATLPDGFPAEIPVVPGTIAGKSIDVPGSSGGKVWNLSVTDINADSYDQAEQLLTGAGFKPIESDEKWTRRHCERQSQFHNDAKDGGGYVVHLCGGTDGPGYKLDYNVNAYPAADWQPPAVPAPPVAPAPPVPAPSQPPR